MDDRDEIEQVPWQDLLVEAEPEDQRRRTMYLAAGLIGAMVVGMLVARMWWDPGAPPPIAPAEIDLAEDQLDDEGDGDEAAALPEIPALPLYSEADLMAFPAGVDERAAIARAEWFVTDYFTADLDPAAASELRASLPDGAVAAGHPHDTVDGGIAYVEWARAFRVETAGDNTYRVGVAFRMLAAPPDRGFTRQPVRAVEVTVSVRPDGGTAVADIPTPILLPPGTEHLPIAEAEAEPPATVVEAALAQANGWGAEPRLVSAHRAPVGWRVVISVVDAVGNRWPLAVRVSGV